MIPPQTLLQNRYLVLEQIGKGGMGVVYKATDQRFDSTVALKEIFLDAPALRKAFEREARLLNHLRHAALPRVSDHFMEEDGQFLVMEFIPGTDLSQTLKQRKVPFTLTSVLDWADQLLDALEYLHTHEPPVIHRDIKPQNLKLTPRGHVVLLDFGLAKGAPSQASRVTETGSVFGYSFNYAPIEQMQATGTDPRSDLYSLGATLYHLLTNVTPPDAVSRASALVNGEPDPLRPAHEVQAQVPVPISRVLAAAMEQSAAKRPQSAAVMRRMLREAALQSKDEVQALLPEAQASAQEQTVAALGARATEKVNSYQPTVAVSLTQDALTVIEPTIASSHAQPARAARNSVTDSVATRVRTQIEFQPQSSVSGRVKGLFASAALLLLVAAAVLFFVSRPAAQSQKAQSVTPSSEAPQPTSNVNTTSPEENAPATVRQPAVASNPTAQSNSAVSEPSAQPATPDNSVATQPQPSGSPDGSATNAPALTPEAERARIAEEIRRERRERDEQEMRRQREALEKERERELEMQRERELRRTQPPPPPHGGFPPPRREGPPPPRPY